MDLYINMGATWVALAQNIVRQFKVLTNLHIIQNSILILISAILNSALVLSFIT